VLLQQFSQLANILSRQICDFDCLGVAARRNGVRPRSQENHAARHAGREIPAR
jgi:hypothetical protein